MDRATIRRIAGDAVSNPTTGNVADALDLIADALDRHLNPPARETRVIEPEETR
jgi:hypothetical protein